MSLLLDTHVFLWYITGDSRLSPDARDAIQDQGNEVFLSVASVWEAVIKEQLGKLPLPELAAVLLPRERARHGIAPSRLTKRRSLSYPPCRHSTVTRSTGS